jgi:membrane protein DedA with SNARE-associated domain
VIATEATLAVTQALGPGWLDPEQMLVSAGTWALWVTAAVIFAECGLLIGFAFPGDTLLFSVGLFASVGTISEPFPVVLLVLLVSAIVGNIVGYEIGRWAGPPLLEREGRSFLSRENVERTRDFFDRYGAPAIVLARFVPIVRTVITVTAGAALMDRRRYLVYTALGGVLWVCGITSLGYSLGNVPFVQDHVQPHLDLILLGVVLLSVLPAVFHVLRERRIRQRERAAGALRTPVPEPPPEPLDQASSRSAGS